MMSPGRLVPFAALVLVGSAVPASAQAPVSFGKDVLPIFQRACQNCHGADAKGGLKLDNLDNVRQGGNKGSAIVSGNADQSRLIQYLDGRLQPRMPLGLRPLAPAQIATIRAWIQAGAKDDAALVDVNADKPLSIAAPKDGADVREKVAIVVPRNSIPPGGFVAVYIDGKFRVALAPPAAEDMGDVKGAPDAPVTYIWDTKQPASDDPSASAEDQILADGPHVIEVRSYKQTGAQSETVAAQVNVKNGIDYPSNYPARLMYGGIVGKPYEMQHHVVLDANAINGGRFRAAPAPGPEKLSHEEMSRFLVSLEDQLSATGMGFYRERRQSPLTVILDKVRHTVRFDSSSRYYTMDRTGFVKKSRQMDREKREPIVNPIDLPGRPQRMNETFPTNLRVNLGGYIAGAITIDRLQATLEGLEWQHGERCVKIRLSYIAGNSEVDIKSMGLTGVKLAVQQGISTLWFSEETQRIIMAKHDIRGTLTVDSAQFGQSQGGLTGDGLAGGDPGLGGNGPGGFGPGGFGPAGAGAGFGAGGNGPGGFGSPFGGRPSGPGGFGPAGAGAGFGPGAGSGGPGGFGPAGAGAGFGPGAGSGGPGGFGPAGAGAGFGPGAGSGGPGGYPGMGNSGMMGMMGASGGMMGPGGGGTQGQAPVDKQYFFKLKVTSDLVEDVKK